MPLFSKQQIALVLMFSWILTGFSCFVGAKLTPKTDLEPFRYLPWMRRTIVPSLIGGGLVGALMVIFNELFLDYTPPHTMAEILYGLSGVISGAAVLRLCLFTWVYSLVNKVLPHFSRLFRLWFANIAVALPFGAVFLLHSLHLEFSVHDAVLRTLLFFGAPNLIFGSFYWSRGIWALIGANCLQVLLVHLL
jgi:hypothetical protein